MQKLLDEKAHVRSGSENQDAHLQPSAADSSTKNVVRREGKETGYVEIMLYLFSY